MYYIIAILPNLSDNCETDATILRYSFTLLQCFWPLDNSIVGSFPLISFVLCLHPLDLRVGSRFSSLWQSDSNSFHVRYQFRFEDPEKEIKTISSQCQANICFKNE